MAKIIIPPIWMDQYYEVVGPSVEDKPVNEFKLIVARAVRDEKDRLIKQQIKTNSRGNWYIWQRNKIEDFRQLPMNHTERFSEFTAHMAPPVTPGKYHLHCFYNRSDGSSYWKLTTRSTVCKMPGRCKKVLVLMDVES